MQDKSESTLEIDIPADMQCEIVKHLPRTDLFNFYLASKTHQALFQPELNARKTIHTFLRHVVCGEHEQVKAMLEKNIDLLFKREQVKDCSERVFSEISGFEYALWSLDKDLWTLMLDCIPKNEEGQEVLARLLTQYKKLEAKVVTYSLNGNPITEVHFDFKETIIKELETQVTSINASGPKNWDAIKEQWRKGVGGAQRLLPVHVVHWYCCETPFYPIPKFREQQPSRQKQFYNSLTGKDEDWFHKGSKLSVDFAIFKGVRGVVVWSVGRPEVGASSVDDLAAMKELCEVRTNDFNNINQQLEDQLLADNRPMAAHI
ncbi:hypothetical protein TUM19329_12330 [Legionella antarctica]|uniref:F-box domain-containing protein n=1 Tax=Legionella antarctica TaxID=2708020 RepID=A0A6F8T4C4_9GAMM|nr:F-box protein [Legionella antarctica]BCA94872.1 hypothetical protein TUM19329_12330 [Legionella antarctica]